MCVEGEDGPVKGKLSDKSLIEIFSPRSSRYTFIPMGGRSQVMTAVQRLRTSLPVEQYGVSVVGLVDADRGGAPPDGLVTWPFCEIENALLVPESLARAASDLAPDTTVTSVSVEVMITEAGSALREDEIRVRVAARIGTRVFRPGGVDAAAVQASLEAFIVELRELQESPTIAEACERITAEVDAELDDGSFVRRFRGKQLLRSVYAAMSLGSVSYERFCYTLARRAREDSSTMKELDTVFDGLDSLVDAQLEVLLAAEPSGAAT